jgi:AcrR family transcriptional regulator
MAAPKGPRGTGRQRVLDAALPLFAQYGVRGTSLQMIADQLGVTKAAVYHQFHAKEQIALALLEPMFASMLATVEASEREPDEDRRRTIAVEGLVDVLLAQRNIAFSLDRDSEMERLVSEDEAHQALVDRLRLAVVGPAPDARRLVAMTVFASGLISAVRDEQLADTLDPAALRFELVDLARRLFG